MSQLVLVMTVDGDEEFVLYGTVCAQMLLMLFTSRWSRLLSNGGNVHGWERIKGEACFFPTED